MDTETSLTLSAAKFISGASDHICRLCFSATDAGEVSFEDTVRLQRSYFDETVTFVDMFDDLGVTTESFLPQVLCISCATTTINSYLFQKLCQYSNEKWNEVIDKLGETINLTDNVGPSVQTVFLMLQKPDNLVYTSRKYCRNQVDKKTALYKIRSIVKSRSNYKKTKAEAKIYKCQECDGSFISKQLLVKHIKIHNKGKNPCKQCHKVFATSLQLEDHAERVHYTKKLQCHKCLKMFSTERLLKNHDRMHHLAVNCRLCFKQFPSKTALRAHLDKHEVNKCPKCNKNFLNKQTYKFHLKICGNPVNERDKVYCDICNKAYAHKNGLRTHLKIYHGFGAVISCKWCDKKFDAKSKLKNHIVTHTKERNFHCDQCGGKFVTPAALVYHTRLHTGEKPFPCDLCNESFLSASRRMEHKRRKHLGPSEECHICHVKFFSKPLLKQHIQRHYNPQSKLYVNDADQQIYKLEANGYFIDVDVSAVETIEV